MNRKFGQWVPRVSAVALVIFVSLFALDVFDQPQWLLALVMHLIPSYILIAITIVAWRNERVGGLLFVVAGLAVLLATRLEAVIIAVPAVVIGGLFLAVSAKSNKYLT